MVCGHIQQSVLHRDRGGLRPELVEFYVEAEPKGPPAIYYFLCEACAEKVRKEYGDLTIRGAERWEECARLADAESAVCWDCFTEIFPDVCIRKDDRPNQRPDGTPVKSPPSNPGQVSGVPHP